MLTETIYRTGRLMVIETRCDDVIIHVDYVWMPKELYYYD
jgi:hypothetical protein